MVRMLVMVFLGSDCSVLCFAAYKQLQTFIFLLKDPGWTGWDWQGLAPGCRLGPNLFGLAAAWGRYLQEKRAAQISSCQVVGGECYRNTGSYSLGRSSGESLCKDF